MKLAIILSLVSLGISLQEFISLKRENKRLRGRSGNSREGLCGQGWACQQYGTTYLYGVC